MNNIKKLSKFAICLSTVLIFATSCTSAPQALDNSNISEAEQASLNPSQVQSDVISAVSPSTKEIVSTDSVNTEYTEYASYLYDMDGDGTDEKITLTVIAEKDSKGELILNDGQNWQLYVQKGEQYYLLIDQYVQNGEISFNVADYYEDDAVVPTIVTTTDTNSMLKLTAYTFSSEKDCFIERVLYDSSDESVSGINKMYSSDSEAE